MGKLYSYNDLTEELGVSRTNVLTYIALLGIKPAETRSLGKKYFDENALALIKRARVFVSQGYGIEEGAKKAIAEQPHPNQLSLLTTKPPVDNEGGDDLVNPSKDPALFTFEVSSHITTINVVAHDLEKAIAGARKHFAGMAVIAGSDEILRIERKERVDLVLA